MVKSIITKSNVNIGVLAAILAFGIMSSIIQTVPSFSQTTGDTTGDATTGTGVTGNQNTEGNMTDPLDTNTTGTSDGNMTTGTTNMNNTASLNGSGIGVDDDRPIGTGLGRPGDTGTPGQ